MQVNCSFTSTFNTIMMTIMNNQNKTKQKNYIEFSPHAKTTDNDIDNNNNNNNNNNNTNNRKLIKKKTKQNKEKH